MSVPAINTSWNQAEVFLVAKRTGQFLGALAFQEANYDALDASLRKVKDLIDQTLNSDVNAPKVLLQPRGSYASRSALRDHVDLDLDLVIPEDFQIILGRPSGGVAQSRTITQVLGSPDPWGENPGNGRDPSGNLIITRDGLRMAMIYVWGRLVSSNYVLPPMFSRMPLDIPNTYTIPVSLTLQPDMQIIPTKTLSTLTRSISAQITDNATYNPLDVDFFIKVVTERFGGEKVLIGVDKDGPLGVRQYQTTTFIPSGKEWLGSRPLSPINRTAILALKWWKNSFATDPTLQGLQFTVRDRLGERNGTPADIKLKSHHFLAALNALHEVPPTDPLYVPIYSSLPFSLVRVIDVMLKVLSYLQRAYQPAQRFLIAYGNDWDPSVIGNRLLYPFPPISCGTFETLYKQLATSDLEYDAVVNSAVILSFADRLQAALSDWAQRTPAYRPDTYVFEP